MEENKRQWYSREDCSLYTGLPGVAYAFYHYGKYFDNQNYISVRLKFACLNFSSVSFFLNYSRNNPAKMLYLYQRAAELIEKCIDGLRGKRHVTFLTGNAGPFALGAVIYHLHADKEESKNMISKFVSSI